MKKYIVLYNPNAATCANGLNFPEEQVNAEGSYEYVDITAIEDIHAYIKDADAEADVIVTGGDGTLNKFINNVYGKDMGREVYYCPSGSGNDFFTDTEQEELLVPLSKYIADLPIVYVKDKKARFINGIGYGIDGYCCEVGDELHAKGAKKINYAGIAIKGLLFHYKRSNATVIVDGEEHKFDKVWLAPTMKGRYYGGGMKVAPDQERFAEDKKLSLVVMYGQNKLKSLMVFPTLFKGTHVEHTEMIKVFTGNEITVRFDKPQSLQIDGETVLNVSEYTAKSAE